jgi:hypothetical protein
MRCAAVATTLGGMVPANTYCALSDIQNLISATGVTLRTDDAPPSTLGDVILMAGCEIDTHLWTQYAPADLVNNQAVTYWAAVLATVYLCLRRGNQPPAGLVEHYKRVMGHLEQGAKGKPVVPYCTRRKSFVPVLSAMRATMAPYPRAVVERSRSTGIPANYDQGGTRDPFDRAGLNNSAYLDYSI